MPDPSWRKAARADLLMIVAYFSQDSPDAAQSLKNEIEAKVARLPDNPRIYRRGRLAGTREMVVRSNYIVIYSDAGAAITVLRIMHAARKWP